MFIPRKRGERASLPLDYRWRGRATPGKKGRCRMQSRARTAVAWLAVLVLGVVIAAGAQQTVEIQQIVNIQPVT